MKKCSLFLSKFCLLGLATACLAACSLSETNSSGTEFSSAAFSSTNSFETKSSDSGSSSSAFSTEKEDLFAPKCIGVSVLHSIGGAEENAGETGPRPALHKYETFYFGIHFDNPKAFFIHSVTINGTTYAGYMFESESTFDTLYLKSTAPDSYGNHEYAISAARYIDGDSVKDVRVTSDTKAGINVIAYRLSLDPTGGEVEWEEMGLDYGNEFVLPTPILKGFSFLGWYDEAGEEVKSGVYDYECDLQLTAKWTPVNYPITYNLDGGTLFEENPSSYTIIDGVSSFLAPTKPGFSFLGWFNEKDQLVESIGVGSTGDIALTAKWAVIDYQITYDLNGGTIQETNPSTYR